MTPADKYAERAKEIAAEGHCRYCDNARIEPVRLECARDIQDTANDIARALEQAALDAIRKAHDEIASLENPYKVETNRNAAYQLGWSQGRASCCARLKELMEGKDAKV